MHENSARIRKKLESTLNLDYCWLSIPYYSWKWLAAAGESEVRSLAEVLRLIKHSERPTIG
jgi:hypothetical protein